MAITRLPKPVPDDLPPARLYLDDIEEIATILAAALGETTPEVKQGEKAPDIQTKFRIDDKVSPQIGDFEHLKKRTHDLTVTVSKGNCQARIFITESNTFWSSFEMSREKSLDTHSKLKTVFDEKKLWWRARARMAPWWTFLFFYPAVFILTVILASLYPQLKAHSAEIASIVATLLTLVAFAAVFIGSRRHSTVILSYSSDARAKREELWSKVSLILITALVTLFGTLLAQYILRKIFH